MGTAVQEYAPTAISTGSHARRYWAMFAFVVIVGLSGIVLSIALLREGAFANQTEYKWIRQSQAAYEARNAKCDVLIFGDSTAMTGLDPNIIGPATELKTCNIAISLGAMVVVHNDPLKVFLQHNARPRVLVLQYAYSTLHPGVTWPDSTYIEGVNLLVRYYPLHTALWEMVRHPDSFVGVMHFAGELTGHAIMNDVARLVHRGTPQTAAPLDLNAHFTLPEPSFANCAEAQADIMAKHLPDPAYVARMRAHYQAFADHVVFDVAPVPVCDKQYPRQEKLLESAGVKMQQFPPDFYNEGWVHFSPAGSETLSREVAGQVASLVARSPEPFKGTGNVLQAMR